MAARTPRVVLFDFDGVISIEKRLFSERLAERMGVPLGEVTEFFRKEFGDCLVGKADVAERIRPYLRRWNWDGTVRELLDFWYAGIDIDGRVVSYAAGLRRKGLIVGIATNQDRRRAARVLTLVGGKRAFPHFFAASRLGVSKPDSAFFRKVFRELRSKIPALKREDILFWDDTAAYVKGARVFGIRAELYESYASFRKTMKGRYGL